MDARTNALFDFIATQRQQNALMPRQSDQLIESWYGQKRAAENTPPWQQNGASLSNPAPRPQDWAVSSGVAEAVSPTMGAYGMGAMTGEVAGALRAGDYQNALTSSLPLAAMAVMPGPKVAKQAEQPKGIRAYHGSPHDFDRFSMDKIGTGEGAQAFGHGLYFAESEGVAKSYRDALTQDAGHEINFRGEPYDMTNQGLQHRFDGYVLSEDGDRAMAAAAEAYSRWPEGTLEQHLKVIDNFDLTPDQLGNAQQYLKEFSRRDPGRLYEVRINAEPEQFLDWDKPLTEQSDAVTKALRPAIDEYSAKKTAVDEAKKNVDNAFHRVKERNKGNPDSNTWDWSEHKAAKASYEALKHEMSGSLVNPLHFLSRGGNPVTTAEALRNAGIPGIRYLDQGSRSAGEGTHNYVVFDDKLIDIMRKYGLLGPMAGVGAAGANNALMDPYQ